MRATLPGLASELKWPEQSLSKAFAEPFRKGMVKVDEKACFIWLPNFLKYNQPENPNVLKAWGSALDLLPECDLKSELMQHVAVFVKGLSEPFRKAFESLREGFAKPFRKPEPEPEQEQEPVTVSCAELSPTVISMPLVSGEEYPVSESDVQEWQQLYPAIDAMQELRNCRGWNLSHPKKRKTKSGIRSHINGWLAKEQNKGGRNGNGTPAKESLEERNRQVVQQALSMEATHESQ
jgi:hypothetical protein